MKQARKACQKGSLFYLFLKLEHKNFISADNVHIANNVTRNVTHQILTFLPFSETATNKFDISQQCTYMYIAYINKCNKECQPSRLAFLLSSKADTNKFDIFRQCTCVLHISISLTRNVNHQRLAFLLVSKAYTNN